MPKKYLSAPFILSQMLALMLLIIGMALIQKLGQGWLFSAIIAGAGFIIVRLLVAELLRHNNPKPLHEKSGDAISDSFADQAIEHTLPNNLYANKLLLEATLAFLSAHNIDELLQTVLQYTDSLMPDWSAIILKETNPNYQIGFSQTAEQPFQPVADHDLIAVLSVLQDDQITVQRDNVSNKLAEYLLVRDVVTLNSFPLNAHGSVQGWLLIGFAAAQEFTSEQHHFIINLIRQAGLFITNWQLLVRTEESLSESSTLYYASQAITDAHTPTELLATFVPLVAAQPINHAMLYTVLDHGKNMPYTMVEVSANLGNNPAADPIGTRYRFDRFSLWEEISTPNITYYEAMTDNELFIAFDFQSAIVVPLNTSDNRLLGAILIGLDLPWRPPESDTPIYQSLAGQAAFSLENIQREQQTQRRAQRLSAAAEVTRAVTSILSMDKLLSELVNLIRDTFGYDHAQVLLLNANGKTADLVAATGEAGRQLLARRYRLPVGSRSAIGKVITTGQAQLIFNTADPQTLYLPNPLLPKTRSEMTLPLIARDQILGVLDVQSNQFGVFTEEDIQVLTSMADMVAISIDNARLFELSGQHAKDMAFLFNITTAATVSLNLTESLEYVVTTLRSAIDVTSATIYLPDNNRQFMFSGASIGTSYSETKPLELSDQNVVGWVVNHNQAINIDDLTLDPRQFATEATTRSVMAMPLQTGKEFIGVLAVTSKKTHAFNTMIFQLLQTLSGPLAAIVQNSRLLQEMQEINEKLREIDQLKTNFLAAMSHELRTPLNSIIGFSHIILKGIDGPLTTMQEQDIETIRQSGKHLLGLVNDILDQAKIEAGKMTLSFAYFKLPEVITSVMSSAIGLTRDKLVRLHTEIDDDLPDVYGDEIRTRQILLNLISNAAKFTHNGSITVSAFPIEEDDQQFIQLSVTDTGIGIAEEDLHLLFMAFQQIDNSLTRQAGGTGMGLPLARSLAELQHGRLWVESQLDIGSTFYVTLPIAPPIDPLPEDPEPLDVNRQAPSLTDRVAMPPVIQRNTILVIEERVETIDLYRRYLSGNGCEILGTTDSKKANNMLFSLKPNIIVLDVNIPDGWDVLSHLKNTDNTLSIPVVVCSMNPDKARALQAGASAYLHKPFTKKQLVDTIQQIETTINQRCILFVDDKPETIRPFSDALKTAGHYNILEAKSGRAALDIIQQMIPIDLVILDLYMPEIDGFDVLRTLRATAHTTDTPVLVLTAGDIDATEQAALDTIEVYRKDTLDEQHLLDKITTWITIPKENN